MLKKIYTVFDRIRWLGIIAILSWMVILCFIQVVLRYFIKINLRPFIWADEVIRLSSIWVAFLAASLGVREGSHLNLEYFVNILLKPKILMILKKIILVMAIASMVLLIYHGIIQMYIEKNNYLLNIRISMLWFNAAIPVGCFYILIEFLLILIFGRHPFAYSSAQSADGTAGEV